MADTKIAPAPAETHYCTNLVQSTAEDTCESLAAQGKIPVDRLVEINPGIDCNAGVPQARSKHSLTRELIAMMKRAQKHQ